MSRRRKRPLTLVSELIPGSTVESYFFLRQFALGAGSGPKLRARLWDRTGEAALIAWEYDLDDPPEDGAYLVVGSVSTYGGNLQVCADHLEPCPPDVDLQELLPAAPRSTTAMWSELERLCAHCTDPDLHALLRLFLEDDDLCERWRQAPAAVRHHHAYAGGLLEHTLGVAGLALTLARHFPSADRELLLVGALLHDIGKTEAYAAFGPPEMTDRGRLLGHVYPGTRLVEEKIRCLPSFPAELRDCLLHLIGSHHGDRQYGVLEVPRTPEALLLHYADNLDAKMHAVQAACQQARGQAWTRPVRSLDDERLFLGSSGGHGERSPRESIADRIADDLFAEHLFDADDFEQ